MPQYVIHPGPRPAPPPPTAGRPGAGLVPPPLAFVNPVEVVIDGAELVRNGVGGYLANKAANLRSELLGQLVAGAATGGPLGAVRGAAAGFAGGQIVPGGSYTLGEYLGAAGTFRVLVTAPGAPLSGLPGAVVRTGRIAFNRYLVVVTVGSNVVYRVIGPPGADASTVERVAYGLTTGGTADTPIIPTWFSVAPIEHLPGSPGAWEWFGFPLTENLDLVPYWEKDP